MKRGSLLICLFLMFMICVITNCKKQTSPIEGYARDTNGFYYKLIMLGDGNDHPTKDQVIVVDAVMKTQSDSIFWDTKHNAQNGLYISLSANALERSCNSYFLKLVEGDSASFYITPTLFFRNYFDTIPPPFCAKDSLIKFDIKLNQIISKSEYKELKKMSEFINNHDTELKELKTIDAFLACNFPTVKADENGIYTLQKITTTNERVTTGKRVKIEYEGFFLDGKSIDNTKQILEFIYGTPDQLIKGLNIIIGTLKKGEFIKIIVPSRLAFGEKGSSNGFILPYTSLVYNIKLIDIK